MTRDQTHTPFIEGRVLTSGPLGRSLAHILIKQTEYLQLPPFQVPLPHWNGSAWYSAVHEADQDVWTMLQQGVKLPCSPMKDKLLILYHLPCWLEVEISYFPGEKLDTNTRYYGGGVNYCIYTPGITAAVSINISLSLGQPTVIFYDYIGFYQVNMWGNTGCGSSHHTCIFQDLLVALNLCDAGKCVDLLLIDIWEEWGSSSGSYFPLL